MLSKITKGSGSELSDDVRTRLTGSLTPPEERGTCAGPVLPAMCPSFFDHAPKLTISRIILCLIGRHRTQRAFGRLGNIRATSGRRSFSVSLSNLFCKYSAVATRRRKTLHVRGMADGHPNCQSCQPALAIPCSTPKRIGFAPGRRRRALSSVGHRLAVEMGSATPEQKVERWQTVVGPVFRAIWPLDVDLQTSAATFQLVQILLATGDVFSGSRRHHQFRSFGLTIPRAHTTIFSIAERRTDSSRPLPPRWLDLIAAVVGEALAGKRLRARKSSRAFGRSPLL